MKRAYLSALGIMGRRHAVGLLRKGYEVDCFDPGDQAHAALMEAIERQSLPIANVRRVEKPQGDYRVAVFSEHADHRLANVRHFLQAASAERFLLEKPLSSDPQEVETYLGLFAEHGVDTDRVFGNFTRRAWEPMRRLKTLCGKAGQVHMSVHGGAYGIGGNGIHHIDLFLFLTGEAPTEVTAAEVFSTTIRSGRGERFVDYGGRFDLRNTRGMMTNLCVPTSSVAPLVVVTGETFSAIINERTLEWELAERNPESTLPPYRCGADYAVTERGIMDYIAMDTVSGLWADGEISLPNLTTVLAAHRLVNDSLAKAGVPPPYRYT